MSQNNVFAIDSVRQIDSLVSHVGDMATCRRLGFILEDDAGVLSLSTAGMGYLFYVKLRDIRSVAEAFAAGRACALEETEHGVSYDLTALK